MVTLLRANDFEASYGVDSVAHSTAMGSPKLLRVRAGAVKEWKLAQSSAERDGVEKTCRLRTSVF